MIKMISINENLCIGCEACIDNCPVLAITYNKKKDVVQIDVMKCIGCESCIEACPRLAIIINKKNRKFVPS